MSYTPPVDCPACGTALRSDDNHAGRWECRHCHRVHRTAEVVPA